MKNYNIDKIVGIIRKKICNENIDFGMVLGSGINIDNIIKNKIIIPYKDLNMPNSKVKGHSGCFVFGKIGNKNILCASRYHYYECVDMNLVGLPYLIMNKLGVKKVILQSSSAGINSKYQIGDVVNITDHINFTGSNPLMYCSDLKFINMSNAYNEAYIKLVKKVYKEIGIDYKSGTHIQFLGPNYETNAEINMASKLGADTISMSLVYDNLLCRYYDINVVAFAIITNIADKQNIKTLSHTEVLENCRKANESFVLIIQKLLLNINE